MTTRIIVDARDAEVYSEYWLKDVVKTVPGRRWDPDRRAWLISVGMVTELAERLREHGERVIITDRQGDPWPPKRHTRKATGNVFEPLFAAVGPELRERIFKALTKVLHPDVSRADTHALMQQLNDERSRDDFPRGRSA